ncbi:hypothetical protein [Enterobacter roggenkampii]|uniref:hypothetical protein n=1 Tax=Enterobacter roggenkampii TaxID=1812935 RepID=UPI0010420945|nr:hypothetical protein [Enterobacter roggenkampii]
MTPLNFEGNCDRISFIHNICNLRITQILHKIVLLKHHLNRKIFSYPGKQSCHRSLRRITTVRPQGKIVKVSGGEIDWGRGISLKTNRASIYISGESGWQKVAERKFPGCYGKLFSVSSSDERIFLGKKLSLIPVKT